MPLPAPKEYTVSELIVEGRNNNYTNICMHNWDKFNIVKKCLENTTDPDHSKNSKIFQSFAISLVSFAVQ